MAVDKKISQLASGAPAQAGDEYVVARSGANFKLTLTNIAASMPPIGATTPNTGSFTSLTNSGNLTFSSTGQRITGDFGNATPSNRVMFQNSVTNANTQVEVIPNGTATVSGIVLSNNSDPNNCSNFFVGTVGTTDCRLSGNSRGTGTLLPMTFYTGGSERMRLDTSGNLGIGTASPTNLLEVYSATAANIALQGNSTTAITLTRASTDVSNSALLFRKARGTIASPTAVASGDIVGANIFLAYGGSNYRNVAGIRGFVDTYTSDTDISGYMTFLTTPAGSTTLSERMRIDASGNVGIGGTAGAASKLNVLGTYSAAGNNAFAVTANGSIPSGATTNGISFLSVPTTAAASFTCSQLSHFYASQGAFGAGSAVTNQFGFYVESTLTGATNNFGFYSNIASGSNRWNFYAAGTAQNYFAGNVFIGSPSNLGVGVRTAISYEGGGTQYGIHLRPVSDTTTPIWFSNASGTGVGSISQNTTNTSYNTSSDRRLKENIVPADDAGEVIDAIQIVKHDWKVGGHTRYGVIAQDLYQVAPEAVAKGDDGDEIENTWGVDYSKLVPILVKELQTVRARLAALEAK